MTHAGPRVSIGLPVYNGENYLAEALRSLLAQTFADFEIIISDNASTDRTAEICREFTARDKRIRYVSNETNLGPARNYNRVFKLSTGEYFKWAAHDDLYAPEFLEKCVRVLENDPGVVLCHTKTCFIDAGGRVTGTFDDKLKSDSPEPPVRFGDLIMNLKCFEIFGLMRSDALRQTPLHGSFGHADGILLVRLGLMGRFHEIPEYLFFNRDHPTKSIYKYATYRDYAVFYDPRNRGKILLPRWRMGFEYLKSVRSVPLDWRARALCYSRMGRWISTYWKSLAANLMFAAYMMVRLTLSPKRSALQEETAR
jgi:glycosyltransferase involved in cell wall biosynthesis